MDMHFEGVIFQSHAAELQRRLKHPHPTYVLLDVRDPSAFAGGHIEGAVPVSAVDLDQGLPEGSTPATEFLIIGDGPLDERVRQATLALRRHGATRCVEIGGGVREWRRLGYGLAAA